MHLFSIEHEGALSEAGCGGRCTLCSVAFTDTTVDSAFGLSEQLQ